MKTIACAVCASALLLLAACNTVKGVGQDIGKADLPICREIECFKYICIPVQLGCNVNRLQTSGLCVRNCCKSDKV